MTGGSYRTDCAGCDEEIGASSRFCPTCGERQPWFTDDRDVRADGGPDGYRDQALERGRPTEPCLCRACDCPLHTYEGDVGCIWCRNGQHRQVDESKGSGFPILGVAFIVCGALGLAAALLSWSSWLTWGLLFLTASIVLAAETAGDLS